MNSAPLAAAVRRARRRLFLSALMTRLPISWGVALALGAAAVAAGPHVAKSVPLAALWWVVGGLLVIGTLVGVAWARRATPTLSRAALELDSRFGLGERIATALGLSERERDTPAGRALLADAAEQVKPVRVSERFPVRPRWHLLLVPAGAGLVALATLFPVADVVRQVLGESPAQEVAMSEKKADPAAKPRTPPAFKPPELKARADKSKELKDLEEMKAKLDQKYDTDPNRETAEKMKEKAAELTSLEEKVKQFEQKKMERAQKLDQQLQQLQRLQEDKQFQDGPANKLNDALAKGDLKKAQEAVDELRKKAKTKELTKEDTEKLARQVDKMKQQLEQLARDKEREKKLEQAAKKARDEGREKDAESLERELAKVQEERQESEAATKDLRESFDKAKQALEKGDLEEAAKELANAGKSLDKADAELEDLEDAEQFLQRLKGEREAACKKCQGEGKGEGDKFEPKDDAEWTNKGQIGAGRRKEDRNAQTASGEGERIRGVFDPKGRKTYGGATKGSAFKTGSVGELGPAIQSAAQEAPAAADSQRLPRDAKESVKDYFEALGGHGK